MPFCPKCGKEVEKDMNFCPACSHQLKPTESEDTQHQSYTQTRKEVPVTPWGSRVTCEKSSVVAIILSIFLPGIGTAYAGNVIRGLILFLAMIFVPIIAFFAIGISGAILLDSPEAGSAFLLIGYAILAIASFAFYIYCIIDAYRHCEISNELWSKYQGY